MQMQILAALLFVCACYVMWRRAFSTTRLSFVALEKSYQREQLWSCFLLKIVTLKHLKPFFFVSLHQFLWHWHWCCCWPRLQLLAVVASAAPLAAWPGLVASTPPPVHSTCLLHILPAYLSPAPKFLCDHWLDCQQCFTKPLPCRLNWPAQCISCLPTSCPNNLCVKRQRSSSCDHWQSCRFH